MSGPELEFTITCGCGRKTKLKARYMYQGKEVRCACGRVFKVGNNGFTDAQRNLDRFADQLRRL